MISEEEPEPQRDFTKPIRIDGEGHWFHGAEEINHPAVLSLLRRCLRPVAEGGWEVRSKTGARPVLVEDTPRFVTAVGGNPKEGYRVTLDGGTAEPLDPGTLKRDERGFTVRVRDGAFPARLLRNAYIDLGHLLTEGRGGAMILPVADGEDIEVEGGELSN